MANSYQSIRGTLTTLTPVSIGGSQEALRSPYTDYVVSENNKTVHYIDHRAFESELENQGLIDEFSDAIVQMDNNRSNLDLYKFITLRLKVPVEQMAYASFASKGLHRRDRILISEVAKTANRLYIPGSTLKGALCNAIMYDWLTKDPEKKGGKEQLQKWIRQIETCYKDSRNIIEDLEGLERTQKRQRLSREKYSSLRNLKRRLQQQIRKHLEIDSSSLFGSIRDRRRNTALDSHLLRIGDTDPLPITEESMAIYFTQRLNLGSGKLTVPQVKEGITAGRNFSFQWEIVKGFTNPYLTYWNKYGKEEIPRVLDNFSLASIRYEMELCEELLAKKQIKEIADFKNEYQDIVRLSNQMEKNETLIRIGSGKTYYDNSYGLALHKENPEVHKIFRKLFRLEAHQDIYPITRTVIVQNSQVQQPLGWGKIIIE